MRRACSSMATASRLGVLRRQLSTRVASANPLVSVVSGGGGLPHYSEVKAEHVVPGITAVIDACETELAELEASLGSLAAPPAPADIIDPLCKITDRLAVSWGVVGHLKAVTDTEELRAAVEEVLPRRVQFGLRMGQSAALYAGFKSMLETAGPSGLSEAEVRICEAEVRDAELSGIGLEPGPQARFNEIQQELTTLGTSFSNHVLDATKAYQYRASGPAEVDGIPPNVLGTAAATAAANGFPDATAESGPWFLTLDGPSFMAVLQHCTSRTTRQSMYKAHATRASDQSDAAADNTPLIEDTLRLRHERAELLGYPHHAELSCASKMATVDQAMELIEELREAAYPFAVAESFELQQFAEHEYGVTDELLPFDRAFYAERLRERKYAYSEDEVKPYFSLPRVMDGLFSVCNRLFGVDIALAPEQPSVWNSEVKLYQVSDKGKPIAYFYLDAYARPEEKRGGAWMDECVSRAPGRLPVAHIVCNQSPPSGDQPALMTFRDVETMFHEFGHALQHMLTEQDIGMVAGIRGVEWDAVEIPSQFMENWCYDERTINGMAIHHETGDVIPKELFGRIKAARNFMAGTQTLRQLYFAMIDLKLHQGGQSGTGNPHEVPKKLTAAGYQVAMPMEYDRFLCAFSHIFAGPYAAGYFSYKWSEVLSADCFSAFEDAGLHDEAVVAETGRRFRSTILSLGGGRAPALVFEDFRGRGPKIDALLKHSGLVA